MTIQFPELAQLLAYDQDKVQRVVWEFYRLVTKDLHRMEQAAAMHQWQTVRNHARRIQVSCLQVGEHRAAEAAAALACHPSEFFTEAFSGQRSRIMDSLDRAEQFVGWRMSGGESSSDPTNRETVDR